MRRSIILGGAPPAARVVHCSSTSSPGRARADWRPVSHAMTAGPPVWECEMRNASASLQVSPASDRLFFNATAVPPPIRRPASGRANHSHHPDRHFLGPRSCGRTGKRLAVATARALSKGGAATVAAPHARLRMSHVHAYIHGGCYPGNWPLPPLQNPEWGVDESCRNLKGARHTSFAPALPSRGEEYARCDTRASSGNISHRRQYSWIGSIYNKYLGTYLLT